MFVLLLSGKVNFPPFFFWEIPLCHVVRVTAVISFPDRSRSPREASPSTLAPSCRSTWPTAPSGTSGKAVEEERRPVPTAKAARGLTLDVNTGLRKNFPKYKSIFSLPAEFALMNLIFSARWRQRARFTFMTIFFSKDVSVSIVEINGLFFLIPVSKIPVNLMRTVFICSTTPCKILLLGVQYVQWNTDKFGPLDWCPLCVRVSLWPCAPAARPLPPPAGVGQQPPLGARLGEEEDDRRAEEARGPGG